MLRFAAVRAEREDASAVVSVEGVEDGVGGGGEVEGMVDEDEGGGMMCRYGGELARRGDGRVEYDKLGLTMENFWVGCYVIFRYEIDKVRGLSWIGRGIIILTSNHCASFFLTKL